MQRIRASILGWLFVPMKSLLYASTITALLVVGCRNLNAPNHPSDLPLRYYNTQYDFTFMLPRSWQGYSMLVQRWDEVRYVAAVDKLEVTDHGPVIVLRHPQWKASDPYQDFPIRVFTRSQWEGAGQGPPGIDAGGFQEEIAHNAKYVFAVSSRFNWGESKGWKQAWAIVERNRAASAPPL